MSTKCPDCGYHISKCVCDECDNRPTLRKDVLEAVPEWGVALIAEFDDIEARSGKVLSDMHKYIVKLEQRVAALNRQNGEQEKCIAALEARGKLDLAHIDILIERVAALEGVIEGAHQRLDAVESASSAWHAGMSERVEELEQQKDMLWQVIHTIVEYTDIEIVYEDDRPPVQSLLRED